MDSILPRYVVRRMMPNSKKTVIIAETDAHNQICGLWVSRYKDRVRFMTTEDLLSLSLKDVVVSGAPRDDVGNWIKARIKTEPHVC